MMFDRSAVRPSRSSRSARAPRAMPAQSEAVVRGGKAALPRIPVEALAVESPGHPPAQRRARPNRTGLPDRLKSGIESLSGISLDAVKVYRNSPHPQRLGAHAYARGREIHVAPGQERHLPHEAWHLVQQAQGRVRPTPRDGPGPPINDDGALEREADSMGARALASASPPAAHPRAAPPTPHASPAAAAAPAQLMLAAARRAASAAAAGGGGGGRPPSRFNMDKYTGHYVRSTGVRTHMTKVEYEKLPPHVRASVEANPMTPQSPSLCHDRVDEHLRASARAADLARGLEQPAPPTLLQRLLHGAASHDLDHSDDPAQAESFMQGGTPVGLRASGIAGPDSVYGSGGHSVTVHGVVGNEAIIQDPDHTHDARTREPIERVAAVHGVQPHEMTPEQVEEAGGQRLMLRTVPVEQIGASAPDADSGTPQPRFRTAGKRRGGGKNENRK